MRALVAGMSRLLTPSGLSASTTALTIAGNAPTVPASPAPFAPSGFRLVGTGFEVIVHVRHRVGPRHTVIHKASRQVLTQLSVVDDLLHQRLTESLRDAAMDLAFQANRVHHRADIVDHDIADDLERTGIGVDLDLADVAAIGIGVVVGGEGSRLVEPAFEARRQAAGLERGLGNIGDANASVGAGDREVAVGEFDVDVGRFEQMRCNAFALGDDLVGSHPQGRAPNHRRA